MAEKVTHMARHLGLGLAVWVLFGSVGQAGADSGKPAQADPQQVERKDIKKSDDRRGGPWIWWKDDSARSELRLTAEQVSDIEQIFQSYMAEAKPLREEVSLLEASLNQTLRANTAEIGVVSQQVDKVERKRAELNKLRVLMLYRMRRVLTPEQNMKFQAMVDRWEAAHKKGANQGGHRR